MKPSASSLQTSFLDNIWSSISQYASSYCAVKWLSTHTVSQGEDLYDVDEYEEVVGWQLDTPSPLATLPPGLLVDVYLLAMDPEGSHRFGPTMSRSKAAWRSLLFFMSICKYWRDVILCTHILWRDVQFGDGVHLSLTKKMLQRSVATPLHLTVCYKDAGRSGYIDGQDVELLGPHLSRVEKLHIRVIHMDPRKLMLGAGDAPHLRELEMEVLQDRGPIMPIPLISSTYTLPYLDSLHTSGVAFHCISTFFRPTLKRLRLTNSPYAFCPSIASLIESLQALPLLEDLTIMNFFLNDDRAAAYENPCPDATLICLKSLWLEDNLEACSEILDHIVLPSSVITSKQLTYIGKSDLSDSIDKSIDFFHAMFMKLIGIGVLSSDTLPTIDTLMLDVGGYAREGEVHAYTWDGHSDLIEPYLSGYTTTWGMKVATLQAIVCRALPDSLRENLLHLFITVPHYFPRDEHLEFSRLFHTEGSAGFPNLRKLLLDRTPETWWCLVDAHLLPDATSSTFPFPKLDVLTIVNAAFRAGPAGETHFDSPLLHDTDDFLFHLRDMLLLRKDAGVPIRELSINSAVRFGADDAEMLRELVDVVSWDGRLSDSNFDAYGLPLR